MKIKSYLVIALTATVLTAALPMVDANVDAVNLGGSARADWEDNDDARQAARRTARRMDRRDDARDAKKVTVLPSGCYTQVISGIAYQNCNGVLYQQVPGQVSYVVVQSAGILNALPAGCISKTLGNSMFFECGAQVYKAVVVNGSTVYQLQ
ncbi:DUF6515 family protein [Neptuniibacter sp. QD34_54]|uniref:DUF6515 family protein n=1 Tax=Neptuniibacter sp. QD34_54 TaxID=3398208 RepID=UPI0039F5A93C